MAGKSGNQKNDVESNVLDDGAARLAERIRSERLARSWSLDEMADRSGVSRAMVHRIESGASSPTAALLGRISGALQISMPALLRDTPSGPQQRLVRAQHRKPWCDPETGYLREAITSAAHQSADDSHVPQVTRVTLPPGAYVPFPKRAFEFISQAVWVLSGTLHFHEGETVHELCPDDCLILGKSEECAFENRTNGPCLYVVVVA
ncbi:MAG: XRE family transcriptional regulator [Pseudomonadota bacterium]